jgi:hypothetical protein
MNPTGLRLMGLPAGGSGPRDVTEFYPDELSVALALHGIRAAARSGAWHGENRLRGADGRTVAVSQVVVAHRDHPDGRVTSISSICRDITDQLSSADTLEITEVDTGVDGADAWFPAIDESAWEETELQFHPADARHAHAFRFRTLHRKRSSTPPHVAK